MGEPRPIDRAVGATVGESTSIVRSRIEAACRRRGRSPLEVVLVAVTKTASIAAIREARTAGV